MPDGRQMRADLMGTSGDQMNLQPGVTAARPDGPVRGLNRRGIRTFGFYRTDGNFILTFILNEPPSSNLLRTSPFTTHR